MLAFSVIDLIFGFGEDPYLRTTTQIVSNLIGGTLDTLAVVFYPEKARGFSAAVLSPAEKMEAEKTNEAIDESDGDVLLDDEVPLCQCIQPSGWLTGLEAECPSISKYVDEC